MISLFYLLCFFCIVFENAILSLWVKSCVLCLMITKISYAISGSLPSEQRLRSLFQNVGISELT